MRTLKSYSYHKALSEEVLDSIFSSTYKCYLSSRYHQNQVIKLLEYLGTWLMNHCHDTKAKSSDRLQNTCNLQSCRSCVNLINYDTSVNQQRLNLQSSPEVGSSRNKHTGADTNSMPILTLLRWPPEI